jgi:hypothetical protein
VCEVPAAAGVVGLEWLGLNAARAAGRTDLHPDASDLNTALVRKCVTGEAVTAHDILYPLLKLPINVST